MVAAFLLGVVLTWARARIRRRSAMILDVAELTRMPVRATLMLVAATYLRAVDVGSGRESARIWSITRW